jgi:SAM-dependent methyltransferase
MKSKRIKSASHPTTNKVIFDLISPRVEEGSKILDFGAGHGHMSQRIGDEAEKRGLSPKECIYPCEIVPEEFQYEKVECSKIKTDSMIPFDDNFFDVIFAIEVLEHTPRPYDFFKEAHRCLKSGGTIIISVPNIMHILSRFSLCLHGFGELFPPPSIHAKNAGRICGHIMPLSFPYYHYGLSKEGFKKVSFTFDRRKKSCLFWYFLFWPIFKLASRIYERNLKKYDEEIWFENKSLVPIMNSMDMLSSRSCIIVAEK